VNEFKIEFVERGERTSVLRPIGQLDAQSAPYLLDHCQQVREAGRHLILNLSGVSMIASSGIGALLALVDEYRQSPVSIRLAEVSPAVDSVVRLLNLDQFLAIDASEEAASSALDG
jgi:anti-anti-sigma factor